MNAAAPTGPGRRSQKLGVSLGRIAGIPIVLTWSWFLITAAIALFFGPRVALNFPELGVGAYGVALAYALLLALSVLIHELAHALTARAFGWPTTRIVLNLWGGHTQFETFSASPGRSLSVALAGPAANLVLAVVSWGILTLTEPFSVAQLLANILLWANLLLAAFNLLPGLPLDGGRLVESAVWKATGSQEKGTIAAGWAGRLIVALILAVVLGVPFLAGQAPSLPLIIVAVIAGAVMWSGAGEAITIARMRLRLPEVSAARLKQPAFAVPAATPVSHVRQLLAGRPDAAVILIGAGGGADAVVDPVALGDVPAAAAAATPAAAAARPLPAGSIVPESAAGEQLLQLLARLEGNEFPVIDPRGRVTGLLHRSAAIDAVTGRRTPGRP